MRSFFYVFVFSLLVTLAACNSSSKKENAETAQVLNEGMIKHEVFGLCDTIRDEGASVRISLWLPSDSGQVSKTIRDQLNTKAIERINSYNDSASIALDPAAEKNMKIAADIFTKNYNDFKNEFPDAHGCWEIELTGDTLMATSRVLIYQMYHYAFTGGAHPNHFTSLHIFDGRTGKEREMKSFVLDTAALLKKAEIAFRKLEKLAPDVHLEEEGYFLKNNQFFLPANYIFTRKGILFYYNRYEIAPYVKGAITFTIPYGELEGIVKKELIF